MCAFARTLLKLWNFDVSLVWFWKSEGFYLCYYRIDEEFECAQAILIIRMKGIRFVRIEDRNRKCSREHRYKNASLFTLTKRQNRFYIFVDKLCFIFAAYMLSFASGKTFENEISRVVLLLRATAVRLSKALTYFFKYANKNI